MQQQAGALDGGRSSSHGHGWAGLGAGFGPPALALRIMNLKSSDLCWKQ